MKWAPFNQFRHVRLWRVAGDPGTYRCGAERGQDSYPVDDLGVDLLTLSGHKIHGPKGIGRSMCRGTVLDPIITGGPQERGLRGGTEHVAAIVGLGLRPSLRHAHVG